MWAFPTVCLWPKSHTALALRSNDLLQQSMQPAGLILSDPDEAKLYDMLTEDEPGPTENPDTEAKARRKGDEKSKAAQRGADIIDKLMLSKEDAPAVEADLMAFDGLLHGDIDDGQAAGQIARASLAPITVNNGSNWGVPCPRSHVYIPPYCVAISGEDDEPSEMRAQPSAVVLEDSLPQMIANFANITPPSSTCDDLVTFNTDVLTQAQRRDLQRTCRDQQFTFATGTSSCTAINFRCPLQWSFVDGGCQNPGQSTDICPHFITFSDLGLYITAVVLYPYNPPWLDVKLR